MSETTDLLAGINADVLLALARKLGAPATATRKPELIVALDQLVHGDTQRILDHLSDAEKQLLAEAACSDGGVDTVRFAAKYGVKCPLPARHVYPPSTASPLLLFIGDQYGPRRLPDSVAKVLRTLLEEPAAVKVTATDSLPAVYAPPSNRRTQGASGSGLFARRLTLPVCVSPLVHFPSATLS